MEIIHKLWGDLNLREEKGKYWNNAKFLYRLAKAKPKGGVDIMKSVKVELRSNCK